MLRSDQPPTRSPTLIDLCEEFFLEVGRVIRSSEYGGESDLRAVRDRLSNCLDKLHGKAHANGTSGSLRDAYDEIEPVLAYFADDVIAASDLPIAKRWNGEDLLAAHERIKITDGAQRFYHVLEAAMREKKNDRLEVFLACLGLGFGGMHRGNRATLQGIAKGIVGQLGAGNPGKIVASLCPQALQFTDPTPLHEPIRERIGAIRVVSVALLLAVPVAYFWILDATSGRIGEVLGRIIEAGK